MAPSDLEKLMAQMPMRDDPFAMVYSSARELEAALKSRDLRRLNQLDFGVAPQVSSLCCFRTKF
jgi:hypothetical protein